MENIAPEQTDAQESLTPEQNPEVLAKSLAERHSSEKKPSTPPKNPVKTSNSSEKPSKKSKKLFIIIVIVLVLLLAGGAAFYFLYYKPKIKDSKTAQESTSSVEKKEEKVPSESKISPDPIPETLSRLTGEPISPDVNDSSPTYCVQIPNGLDGARPQAGLTSAKIVFEAIAEAGITRLAAIFQYPPAVIGPIRSLRIYYLNWDVPFDCTVVHAGGADDAISALKSYGTRELDENYSYMWRTTANAKMNRLWNNLFTSGEKLTAFNESRGYLSSNIKSFPRLTPSDALKNKVNTQAVNKLVIDQPSTGDTNELTAKINHITFRFGDIPSYNPVYTYNKETNTYDRSFETGAAHESYDCEGQSGEITPELACPLKQISPSVVIAMIVQERRAAYDNYHEDISSIGAGDAYIFQNGNVIKGTWEKSSPTEQIIFRDEAGKDVSLVPGQTWISAVPSYGAVNYE